MMSIVSIEGNDNTIAVTLNRKLLFIRYQSNRTLLQNHK